MSSSWLRATQKLERENSRWCVGGGGRARGGRVSIDAGQSLAKRADGSLEFSAHHSARGGILRGAKQQRDSSWSCSPPKPAELRHFRMTWPPEALRAPRDGDAHPQRNPGCAHI